MMELVLSATEISDLRAFGEIAKIRELPAVARQVIQAGGRVIIRQTFVNAEPKDLKVFTTESQIDNWEKEVADFIRVLTKK